MTGAAAIAEDVRDLPDLLDGLWEGAA